MLVIDKFFIFVLMTKLKTYLMISVIFPIKVHQTIDKVVKITNFYAHFYILHQYCAQRHSKYRKILLQRCIHHFKYDLISNMGHVRISVITLSVDIHFRPGMEIISGVGPILSVVSEVASGIGRGWSYRAGVGREERDLSVGASGIQRGYSGC